MACGPLRVLCIVLITVQELFPFYMKEITVCEFQADVGLRACCWSRLSVLSTTGNDKISNGQRM